MEKSTASDLTQTAFDGAEAAFSACAAMTAVSLNSWLTACEAFLPKESKPRSWYRKPSAAGMANPFETPWAPAFAGGPSYAASHWRTFYGGSPAYNFGAAWLSLFPLQGPPASWPIAFALIANGVPRAIAIPAAQANAAVMEAAAEMAKPVAKAFGGYRGEGGHAMSFFAHAPYSVLAAMAVWQMSNQLWPMAFGGSPFAV